MRRQRSRDDERTVRIHSNRDRPRPEGRAPLPCPLHAESHRLQSGEVMNLTWRVQALRDQLGVLALLAKARKGIFPLPTA